MTFSIVVPEVVTASAFAQHVSARQSVKAVQTMKGDFEWTMRHAFYWNMGGVWIMLKDQEFGFPVNATQQKHLFAAGVTPRPCLSSKEIWDKSKADKFVKLLACIQIAWLSVQSISRAIQGLPVSVLEVATVGFALPSLASFVFWFSKPNNIETPTIVQLDLTLEELLDRLKCPSGGSWVDTPLDALDTTHTVNRPSFVSEVVLKARLWPGRKRFEGRPKRIRNDVFGLKYAKMDQVLVGSIWLGYSAIHLAAWNFEFPSTTERLMWRINCLLMAGSMVIFWIAGNRKTYLLYGYLRPSKMKEMEKISNERERVSPAQIALCAVAGIVYLVSRLSLIVLALTSMRALPAGAYKTINWTKFFPHV